MYPELYNVRFVQSDEASYEAMVALRTCVDRFRMLAVDTETTGLDPKKSDLVLLTIATPDTAYVFTPQGVSSSIRDLLRSDTQSANLLHAATFDWGFIAHHLDVQMITMYDTRRAQHAQGHRTTDSLKLSAQEWLGIAVDKSLQTQFVGKQPPYNLTQQAIEYAAQDTLILWPLFFAMRNEGGYALSDFVVLPEDIIATYDYINGDAPWPNTREYPSLTQKLPGS
jgi:ribonuclease D